MPFRSRPIVDQMPGYGEPVPCPRVDFELVVDARAPQRRLQALALDVVEALVDFGDPDVETGADPRRQQVRAVRLHGRERAAMERGGSRDPVGERARGTDREPA